MIFAIEFGQILLPGFLIHYQVLKGSFSLWLPQQLPGLTTWENKMTMHEGARPLVGFPRLNRQI